MEKRKDSLSNIKVCRFCLTAEESLIPLYDNKVRAPKNSVPFALKILACIAIEIFPSDSMPQFICQRCKLFMELSYAFKQLCRQADETILQFIQNGAPLAAMPWPAQLSKVYKLVNKTEVNVVKTVMQGGATVKVMAEEISDSEEGEDDNVYNVKIGDGSEEGKSIKIITSIDQSTSKGRQGTSKKFPSVAKLTRHVREHAGVRPYPCKHCDKSFTKSHHYTRHLRVKHAETTRIPGQYNEADAYRCDECEETFGTQDELMYHSALHATRNLICPLCQEKFDDVDTVTAHIKSHVNGTEFMCDFCELIFTSKEKLENHIARSHDDELLAIEQETENDESSMDMDADDDDDNSINVKEENGEMVVEIKKAGEYMLPVSQTDEDKGDNTQSEDSDMNYADSPVTELEAMPTPKRQDFLRREVTITKISEATPKESPVVIKPAQITNVQPLPNPSPILRKAEDVKRKAAVIQQQQPPAPVAEKRDKAPVKVETSSAATGASDKSLRLLEKELQDLKRTNSRTEAAKTPAKTESLRSRRPPLFSSTPKPRIAEKRETVAPKLIAEKATGEKKQADRKGKDMKEPKEVKSNNNTIKEDKELRIIKEEKEHKGNKEDKEPKGISKEDKEPKGNSKEDKEPKGNSKEDKMIKEDKIIKEEKKENAKAVVKNGASDVPGPASDDHVRRSTRPSKVKDYAKMIRDSSMESDDDDTDADEDVENYKELEKTSDISRVRGRRNSHKPTPVPAAKGAAPAPAPAPAPKPDPAAVAVAPRKRGRPRKEPRPVVPSKIKKDEPSEEEAVTLLSKGKAATSAKDDAPNDNEPNNGADGTRTPEANKLPQEPRPGVIISPSGQTLKKVPIKALPPGVKPLPLPVNSRLGGGEVTEMQIGKKIVKVQKIVMTKAEVEAMTKKGLLEIKDGTMVLKQGIKLPAADPAALKSSLVGESETTKESPKALPAPMRCDLDA